jgi:predicted Rdx family selenoprotein
MEKVALGLIVYCTDMANTYELKITDFVETMDEIEIETPVYNEALQRGWIGDISFKTWRTADLNGVDTEPIRGGHDDVLLASVRIWSADRDSGVTWKYRFLKK